MAPQSIHTPFISIVVPSYNFGHLLPYTLDSILHQTFTDWEAIVVDDGSVDDTEAVMAKYVQLDSRFRYQKQVNGGPAKARNTGIALAKGTYLQFLDADDLLQADKFKFQVDILKQRPEIDIVYGQVYNFRSAPGAPDVVGNLSLETITRPKVSGSGDEVTKTFLISTVCVNAPLVRRELVMKLQMLDEELKQAEDWDMYLRAAFMGATFLYQENPPNTMALIRKHDSNNTINFYRLQYYVVKMRQKFATVCTNPALLQLNNQLILKNLEDLIFETQYDLERGNRKRAIDRSFQTLGIHFSFRYLIYAFASLFGSAWLYKKVTRFSFSKLF